MNSRILQLRQQLQSSYPAAQAGLGGALPQSAVTGVSCLDAVGGVPQGRVTEVVVRGGGSLFLGVLLRALEKAGQRAALIDGRDVLDPQSLGSELCQGLLWVRCGEAEKAMQAADLLLRDGNLPFVILDLQWCAQRELRALPNHGWYRLRNLAEETDTTLLVLSRGRMVPCAVLRLELRGAFSLHDLERPRMELEQALKADVLRTQRGVWGEQKAEPRKAG